jgi:Flp pilus assembly protein CpaB
VAPILSDVRVIAVGPTFQKVPGGANNPAGNITVAVDPEDAKKLVKAIVASKLYVTLRNENDHTPVATVDVTTLYNKPAVPKDSMLISAGQLPAPPIPVDSASMQGSMSAIPTAPPPAPAIHEIEMWTGSKKDVLSVPNS